MKVAIIGLGVVGGSIAYALKESPTEVELLGIESNEATLEQARQSGVFDSLRPSPDAALGDAAAIFVCVPIAAVESVFASIAPLLTAESVVTDVSGIKTPVEDCAFRLLTTGSYVGSHPMAGGEKGGFAHAQAATFTDAVVAICSSRRSSPTALTLIETLWSATGATCLRMSPEEHDETIATTSHLPYLIAVTLTEFSHSPHAPKLSGPSYRDATLRADFSPEIMASTINKNVFLPETARQFAERLLEFADLAERRPEEFLQRAHQAREQRHNDQG